ncbi:hypothetical protein HPSH_02980 [Helicobacter pylori Shi470]|nr:hypothetical protein HPSH_02980 [Helicobacter pylori Shi470]
MLSIGTSIECTLFTDCPNDSGIGDIAVFFSIFFHGSTPKTRDLKKARDFGDSKRFRVGFISNPPPKKKD